MCSSWSIGDLYLDDIKELADAGRLLGRLRFRAVHSLGPFAPAVPLAPRIPDLPIGPRSPTFPSSTDRTRSVLPDQEGLECLAAHDHHARRSHRNQPVSQ